MPSLSLHNNKKIHVFLCVLHSPSKAVRSHGVMDLGQKLGVFDEKEIMTLVQRARRAAPFSYPTHPSCWISCLTSLTSATPQLRTKPNLPRHFKPRSELAAAMNMCAFSFDSRPYRLKDNLSRLGACSVLYYFFGFLCQYDHLAAFSFGDMHW